MKSYAALSAVVLTFTACSPGDLKDKLHDKLVVLPASQGAVIHTSVQVAGTPGAAPRLAPAKVGNSGSASLKHLRYYIKNMGICKTAEVQGTGFNMGPDCIVLYEAPQNSLYEPKNTGASMSDAEIQAQLTAARTDTNPDFIDLMDATSRARLSKDVTISTEKAGDYQYGYVYWYYPIKFQADISLADGTALHTHNGPTEISVDQNSFRHVYTVSPTSFTEGTSDEVAVYMNNGGSWFKFQKPFTITTEDITAGTKFKLDLAFNPSGIIKAAGPNLSTGGSVIFDHSPADYTTPTNSFSMPILDLEPVVYRETEHVRRESYLLTVNPPAGSSFDLRYDVYSIVEDPEKNIRAVETKSQVNANTSGSIPESWQVSFVEVDATGNVSLKAWDDFAFLTDFKLAANEGDAVSAVYHCNGGSDPLYNFCGASGELALSGTLTSVSISGQ